MKYHRFLALLLAGAMTLSLAACGKSPVSEESEPDTAVGQEKEADGATEDEETGFAVADPEEKAYIEQTLNLANNADQAWTYAAAEDAWVMSIVPAVAYPELPEQQGVSVCVPGAYVTGIDTDGDGTADVTSADARHTRP